MLFLQPEVVNLLSNESLWLNALKLLQYIKTLPVVASIAAVERESFIALTMNVPIDLADSSEDFIWLPQDTRLYSESFSTGEPFMASL